MKEHVLNIKLMDWPAAKQSQEEHSLHYGGLDDISSIGTLELARNPIAYTNNSTKQFLFLSQS